MKSCCYRLITCLLVLICMGCERTNRPPLVSVTGTVLLDGEPVEGAAVSFIPEFVGKTGYARPSMAITDQSGQFSPGTYNTTDGLPLGKFKIIIIKQEKLTMQGQPLATDTEEKLPGHYKIRWLIPKIYSQPETSELVVEVTATGMTPGEFKLQSAPQGIEVELIRP